jgi:hypothetical protein
MDQSPNSQIFSFKNPGHRFYGIDPLWEIDAVVELILGDIDDSMWRNWKFQNYRHHICCVWAKDTSIGQHTQTILQLSAGDEKLIPALIMNILSDMAVSIPCLVLTQFQEPIHHP